MPSPSRSRWSLCLAFAAGVFCVRCSLDSSDEISDAHLQGSIHGVAWTAGPGAVSSSANPKSPYVVRIFEQGTQGDPCALAPTTGRRVEIGLAALKTGRFEPATDEGYYIETWEGLTGERDPYGAVEIINAPRTKGASLLGKARFGSSGTQDFVEGQFEATVCDDFP